MAKTVERIPVAGVSLSHPDRLIYPELGVSKADLARYFESIADWVVPHVRHRPLTLLHCPAGASEPCLFLRHGKAWGPSALRRIRIREKTKVGEYLVADDLAGVVSLVQMGIVEIHTWNSVADDLERPNRIVWDLDPGPQVEWPAVVDAARLLRGVLAMLDLTAWVKTTGGRGVHVVVPLRPSLGWAQCLEFARQVSELIVRHDPARYTTALPKRGRERRILFDYLRNNRTNTSVCAYSPRARPGAHVSMPIDWRSLRIAPDAYTILTVPRRLRRAKDPWASYWTTPQRISASSLAAVSRL
jgi:bifunctional non-homologous end joining protein LigD